MTLQEVFYFVGIIFLSIYSLILMCLIAAAIYLKIFLTNKIRSTKYEIKRKINNTLDSIFEPKQIIKIAGSAIAGRLIKKILR